MPEINPQELLQKYLSGKATEEEKALLETWYIRHEGKNLPEIPQAIKDQQLEEVWSNLPVHQQHGTVRRLWPRMAAAASVLVILSAGGYLLWRKKEPVQVAQNQKNVILPGSNKAILLSHGKQYMITGAKNGLIVQHGATSVDKTSDGVLAYNGKSNNSDAAMVYDTLIVPRGGQHQVKFADGSMAYVNADSKLRIPENFEGSNRTVELISGEADFHVVHNAKMPFQVIAKGQITKDIGTEFNINAYPDEPVIKTTLIEGSVRVSKNNQSTILKPGQQAQVGFNESEQKIKVVNDADMDEVTAWKDGMFRFNGTPLESIMKQVSRWYNVDVVYQDESLKAKPFGAITTRYGKASELLHVLEMTGKVKFEIEGRKIIVMNK